MKDETGLQHTYDLGIYLKRCGGGRDLADRVIGRALRVSLETVMTRGRLPPGTVMTLDCARVDVIDFTGADECFVKLKRRIAGLEYGDMYLTLAGVTPSHEGNIEVAFSRMKDQIVVQRATGPEILGHLEGYLLEAWDILRTKGEMSARDLADMMESRISLAATKLLSLYRRRLAKRYATRLAGGGQQYVYSVVRVRQEAE